jgi:hypothetical protein
VCVRGDGRCNAKLKRYASDLVCRFFFKWRENDHDTGRAHRTATMQMRKGVHQYVQKTMMKNASIEKVGLKGKERRRRMSVCCSACHALSLTHLVDCLGCGREERGKWGTLGHSSMFFP